MMCYYFWGVGCEPQRSELGPQLREFSETFSGFDLLRQRFMRDRAWAEWVEEQGVGE